MRRRRSTSAASGTWTLNGRIVASLVAEAGTPWAARITMPSAAACGASKLREDDGNFPNMTSSRCGRLLHVRARAELGNRRRTNVVRRLLQSSPAQRSEGGAHLGGEEFRLLPRCKVPTLVELVVVDQLGIRLLCPTPRGRVNLVRKGA